MCEILSTDAGLLTRFREEKSERSAFSYFTRYKDGASTIFFSSSTIRILTFAIFLSYADFIFQMILPEVLLL